MNDLERKSMLWGIEARIDQYSDAEVLSIRRAVDRANRSMATRTGRTVVGSMRSIAADPPPKADEVDHPVEDGAVSDTVRRLVGW